VSCGSQSISARKSPRIYKLLDVFFLALIQRISVSRLEGSKYHTHTSQQERRDISMLIVKKYQLWPPRYNSRPISCVIHNPFIRLFSLNPTRRQNSVPPNRYHRIRRLKMSPVKPIKSSRAHAAPSRHDFLQISKNHAAFACHHPNPRAKHCYYQTNPLYDSFISPLRPDSRGLTDPLLPNPLQPPSKKTHQNMRDSASILRKTFDSGVKTAPAPPRTPPPPPTQTELCSFAYNDLRRKGRIK
jgi:hypothetical protein